jgi:hypothetical protein
VLAHVKNKWLLGVLYIIIGYCGWGWVGSDVLITTEENKAMAGLRDAWDMELIWSSHGIPMEFLCFWYALAMLQP